MILRPWRVPEAVWAVMGAALLVLAGLLPGTAAWRGVLKGTDVYLFLIGMMLLSEVARIEGLFDWLAARAAIIAGGSGMRLFTLIYLVGTAVTVFMSNDATAVVLTPAVAAVVRAVRAEHKLPYVLTCAFIANAASFVLPISNPANLVIYGSRMPPLLEWVPRYALPSLLSIVTTYGMLRLTQRKALRQELAREIDTPRLSIEGRLAACGIGATALVQLTASALDWQLGLPTCVAGGLTAACVLLRKKAQALRMLKGISWGVIPLVAGLFVLVEALDRTGLIRMLGEALQRGVHGSAPAAAWVSGLAPAFVCNLMNNLPAGLVAANAVQIAQPPEVVTGAVLIGIDLGPNLSVTGSLATILWLAALRREGLEVSAGTFLKLGAVVMPPALVAALGALIAFS